MHESVIATPVTPIGSAAPIPLSLSPRDCYRVYSALSAALHDFSSLEIIPQAERIAFDDLAHRFLQLLKDGGHLS